MEEQNFSHRILQLRLTALRLIDGLRSGNYRSLFKGSGLEFSEVRSYVEGDDPRRIDWNVTSRMGEIYSKVFQEERELTLMLLLDLSPSMFVGSGARRKIDQLIRLFALLGFAATHNGDRIGSLSFASEVSNYFKPRKERRYVMQQLNCLLGACQQVPNSGASNLALACQTLYERSNRRGSCVILSDFRTSGYQKSLALLARRHDVVMLRLTDLFDYDFPAVGLHNFKDSESQRCLTVLGQSLRSRHNYALYWEEQRRLWLALAQQFAIPAYEIDTSQQAEEKLLELFSYRRRRR